MANELLKDDDIQKLASSLAGGYADSNSIGLALKQIQVTMGVKLLKNLERQTTIVDKLNDLLDLMVDNFHDKVEALMATDTIPTEELYSYISDLQSKSIKVIELQRKIAQNPVKLFSDDLFTSDERKILKLLNSFKSPADKARFMEIVRNALGEK